MFLLLGCVFWLVDAWLDYTFYYPDGRSFWGLLILDVPNHEIWVRLSSLVLFALFGLTASTLLSRTALANRKLREDRRYYRSIIDSLHESILILGRDYRVVDANALALEALDLSIDEIRGRCCHELLAQRKSPCRDDDHPCRVPELLATGEAQNCHHVNTRRDGTSEHLDVLLSPITDDNGNITHIIRASRDVTDLFEAQAQVERLAKFPQENPEPVLRIDANCKLVYANPAAKEILDHWSTQVGGELPDRPAKACSDARLQQQVQRVRIDLAERTYTLDFVSVPGRDYINIYGKDVTQEHRLQERLYQAQKMEAIGRLAGGVAHDFNNMLTPILGYAEILSLEAPEKLKDEAAQIAHAAQRARELVSQLLSLGRKQMLRLERIDLSKILSGLAGMLKRLVPENVDLRIVIDPEPCGVRADPVHIQQVLINLVVNGVEAMPDGGKMTIETSRAVLDETYCRNHDQVTPGSYCLLCVTDTGNGMDPEVAEKIFEPFFSTKNDTEVGAGLGLATVHGIVKQHQGHINVYSEPNSGTCFKVYLPQVATEDISTVPGEESAPLVGGKEKILVVEDDPLVSTMAKAALTELGYQVVQAPDPSGAMELADSNEKKIQLLLTDVVLPQCNGKELHEKLKQTHPELPVVYMSGYTGNVIQHHGVLDEGIRFLPKPFTLHELATSVRSALDD